MTLFAVSTIALPVGSRMSSRMPAAPQQSVSIHLTLGNPSDATDAATNKDNFLLVKDQYALSFNNTKGEPNWVSWHLQASDIGDESRGDFHPDIACPGFKKIKKATITIPD